MLCSLFHFFTFPTISLSSLLDFFTFPHMKLSSLLHFHFPPFSSVLTQLHFQASSHVASRPPPSSPLSALSAKIK